MPYIKDRMYLDPVTPLVPANPGELNFQFTRILRTYVKIHGLSYQTINDVIGALEGAKLEFQRRIVGPYEDTKIAANGDVGYGEILEENGL